MGLPLSTLIETSTFKRAADRIFEIGSVIRAGKPSGHDPTGNRG